MRSVPLLGGLVWLMCFGAANAQTTYTALVSHDNAEVRAGPNDNPQLYVTNRLARGTAVQVVEELANGWLKIRPPAGSFSLVATTYVQQVVPNQPNWMIVGPADVRAPVIVGTDIKKEVPSQIEGSRLARGTQVTGLGPARVDDQGAWLPIEPPPGEYRYVRADAVTRSDGSPIARVAPPAPGATSVAKPSLTPSLPAGAPPTEAETLWTRAVQYERAGNATVAIDLYNRAAAAFQGTNAELALQARNRAHFLAQGASTTSHSTFTPSPLPPGDFRLTATATTVPPNVQLAGPVGVYTTMNRPQQPALVGTGPGILRRAGRAVEGRTTYVLESYQGALLTYVTAEPGVNLEPYINQKVSLTGPAGYNGELRANYMRAERVQPAAP